MTRDGIHAMTRDGTAELPAGTAAPDVPPYRDGNVLRWLAGFAISLIGDQVYFIALGWAAVQTTGPGGAGLILAAGSVPRLVLLLLGGAFVDRWGARRLMLGSDVLRGTVMAAAAVLTAATSPSLIVLVSVAVVFGMVDAMFLPAVGALRNGSSPPTSWPGSKACAWSCNALRSSSALPSAEPLSPRTASPRPSPSTPSASPSRSSPWRRSAYAQSPPRPPPGKSESRPASSPTSGTDSGWSAEPRCCAPP